MPSALDRKFDAVLQKVIGEGGRIQIGRDRRGPAPELDRQPRAERHEGDGDQRDINLRRVRAYQHLVLQPLQADGTRREQCTVDEYRSPHDGIMGTFLDS